MGKPKEVGGAIEETPSHTVASAEVVLEAPIAALAHSTGNAVEGVLELSHEQNETLATLKANFIKHEVKLQTGFKWEDVEAELIPRKLDQLQRLAARRGELTLVGRDSQGKLLFTELSQESPAEKRNVDPFEANAHAHSFGAELTDPELYCTFKAKDINLDLKKTLI